MDLHRIPIPPEYSSYKPDNIVYDEKYDVHHVVLIDRYRLSCCAIATFEADTLALVRIRKLDVALLGFGSKVKSMVYEHQRDELACIFPTGYKKQCSVVVIDVDTARPVFKYTPPTGGVKFSMQTIEHMTFDTINRRLLLLDELPPNLISVSRDTGEPYYQKKDFIMSTFQYTISKIEFQPIRRSVMIRYDNTFAVELTLDFMYRKSTTCLFNRLMDYINSYGTSMSPEEFEIYEHCRDIADLGCSPMIYPRPMAMVTFDRANRRIIGFQRDKMPQFVEVSDASDLFLAFDSRRSSLALLYTDVGSTGCLALRMLGFECFVPELFVWRPETHARAPRALRDAVKTLTEIRSLVLDSPLSALPNELLFNVFSFM